MHMIPSRYKKRIPTYGKRKQMRERANISFLQTDTRCVILPEIYRVPLATKHKISVRKRNEY